MKITTEKNSVKFSVEGDFASGSIEKKENNSDRPEDEVLINVEEGVTNTFSLSFLNSFNKAASLSDRVVLCLNANSPLVLEYRIEGTGHLKFYLAPKINEND